MKRITKIDLYPVVSFNPFSFDIDKPYPDGLTKEERHEHWKKQMESINIRNLVPIETGFDLVRTTQINKETLITLLEFQGALEPCDGSDNDDDVYSAFNGGVVMEGDNQIIFIPQCCVGLYDYKEWLEVEKTDHFQKLYIGHPWVYTHNKGEDLIFSGLIDNNFGSRDWEYRALDDMPRGWDWGGSLKDLDESGIKELMCQYAVDYKLFQQAQADLKKEVDLFYTRVLTQLKVLDIKNATKKVDRYVHGINGPVSYNPDEPFPTLPFKSY